MSSPLFLWPFSVPLYLSLLFFRIRYQKLTSSDSTLFFVRVPDFRLAAVYIRYKLMPADPRGDALHLALASHHQCDVLVTWNYRHLANRTKLERIRRLNTKLGLFVPRILSPRDLLESEP